MFGGKAKGWLLDVAVVMWRRMLIGALGDPNEVRNPQIHAAIFYYLVELGSILIKVIKHKRFQDPPILILVPWCQKVYSFFSRGSTFCIQLLIDLLQALALPSSYHKGKLMALRLLCTVVVRPHDIALPRNHLLLFFRAIHHALVGQDQVYPSIINSLLYLVAHLW